MNQYEYKSIPATSGSPSTDAASVDAMLNEGGHLQTGNLRSSALARTALADLPTEDRDADFSGGGFPKAIPAGSIKLRPANRRRIGMNSDHQRLWWHSPVIVSVMALTIGVAIFLMSISSFGADVSFMFRKLI